MEDGGDPGGGVAAGASAASVDDGDDAISVAPSVASTAGDGKEKGAGWLTKMGKPTAAGDDGGSTDDPDCGAGGRGGGRWSTAGLRRKTAPDAKKPGLGAPPDGKKADGGRKASTVAGGTSSSSAKLVIGAPSNFTHVKSITPDVPALPKSTSVSSLENVARSVVHIGGFASGLPRQTSAQSAKASIGSDGSATSPTAVPLDEEPDPMAIPANASVKMGILQDLTYGGYFLRHSRGEARQVFLACSPDFQQVNLWSSYYEMLERKQRPEVVAIADIVDIKSGVVFESAEDKHDSLSFAIVLSHNRSLDLEAFTPDDRDRWVSAFLAVRQFSGKS